MKCPICGGTGKALGTRWNGDEYVEEFVNCHGCNGTGIVEPQTNEGWFNGLSTKEKATWLDGLIAYCFGIGHITETEQKKYQNIVADVEKWLKQPHTPIS